MMNVTLLILLGLYAVHVEGFCSRKYDDANWAPHSITKRSVDADIIVYGEIIESPCRKPAPLTTAPPPTTEAIIEKISLNGTESMNSTSTGNSTSNVTTTQTPTTTAAPTTTQIPTTIATTAPMNESEYEPVSSHNCSAQKYNVSLRIHCVIKGGHVPEYINVEGLGLNEDMCVSDYWNETVHEYHAYHGQNYTFFLKRKHDHVPQENSFSLHLLNLQPAMMEIKNATTDLPQIFKVAGGHAHRAMGVWVNKTDPICKPYSGASRLQIFPVAMAMIFSLFAMTTSF